MLQFVDLVCHVTRLLIQGVIPFTMFFSWLVSNPLVARILREQLHVRCVRCSLLTMHRGRDADLYCRYRWGHYLGALIIIVGIVVALLHAFLSSSGASGNSVFGIVVFFLSCTPTAFSVCASTPLRPRMRWC